MKPKHLFISILAVFFVFPLIGTFAQQAPITIQVLTTFDYPGTGNSTLPESINERGDIAGFYTDSSGVTRGFVRFRNGNFSPPIVEPNDTGNFTAGWGINTSRVVSGYFVSDNVSHGFFLSGNVFTEFDVADSTSTNVRGLNDAGDFVGSFTTTTQGDLAFASIGGSIATYQHPGSDVELSLRDQQFERDRGLW